MKVIAVLIFACFFTACGSDRDFTDAVPPVKESPTPIAGLPTIEKLDVTPLDKKQQKELIEVIRDRAARREETEAKQKLENPRKPFTLQARQTVASLQLSPDGK